MEDNIWSEYWYHRYCCYHHQQQLHFELIVSSRHSIALYLDKNKSGTLKIVAPLSVIITNSSTGTLSLLLAVDAPLHVSLSNIWLDWSKQGALQTVAIILSDKHIAVLYFSGSKMFTHRMVWNLIFDYPAASANLPVPSFSSDNGILYFYC